MKCKKCGNESEGHELCNQCFVSNQKMTEGEEVIRDFLEDEAIEYEFQKEVPSLINDKKEFRLADFFLPRYKVYLEFFGKWSNPKNREKYQEKKKIYQKNNVPCIYLYPENLGILHKILKRRIKKVLQDYKELRFQLLKLNWDIFTEWFGLMGVLLAIFVWYVPETLRKIIISIPLILLVYNSLKKSFFRKIE